MLFSLIWGVSSVLYFSIRTVLTFWDHTGAFPCTSFWPLCPTESSTSHIAALISLFRDTANKVLCKLSTRNWTFCETCFNHMLTILSGVITPWLGKCRVPNHPSSLIDLGHLSYWGQCDSLTSCVLFSLEPLSPTLSGADRSFCPNAHGMPYALSLPATAFPPSELPSLRHAWVCSKPHSKPMGGAGLGGGDSLS